LNAPLLVVPLHSTQLPISWVNMLSLHLLQSSAHPQVAAPNKTAKITPTIRFGFIFISPPTAGFHCGY
jgi:hypothetical protein